MNSSRRLLAGTTAMLCLLALTALGKHPAINFEAANKYYEQGKYGEAIQVYQQLLDEGYRSATVYFNLGNACFKAGWKGRAIAAYREAQRFTPREPNLRYNLEFVRKDATGYESPPFPLWKRFLNALTLDEWAALAAGGCWLWFGLLALREIRPSWKSALRGYVATAGAAAVLLGCFLGAAYYQQNKVAQAVVVVPAAILRLGPLEESKVVDQLKDGSELLVLDAKAINAGDKMQLWLEVQTQTSRHQKGWVQSTQIALLGQALSRAVAPSSTNALPVKL